MLKLISVFVLMVLPVISISTTSHQDEQVFLAQDIWTQCGPGGCEGDDDPPPPAPIIDTTPSRGQ